MSMRLAFPRTSAAYPNLMPWDDPFDWADGRSRAAAIRLADMQVRFATLGVREFLTFCDAVGDDISETTPPAVADALPDAIDAFRQLFSAMPMGITQAHGMLGDCYGWTMWSLMRGCDRRGRVFDGLWSAVLYPEGIPADYWVLVSRNIPRWSAALFLLARKFGGLDVPARAIADRCWQHSFNLMNAGGDLDECMSALILLANWASNANEPQAERWVRILQGLWDKQIPDSVRAQLGILMISPAHRFTGRDPQSWANEVLEGWSHLLTEHLLVQVLATSVRDAQDWLAKRERILTAISDLAGDYHATAEDRTAALQALESRVSILHPLIYWLTEFGEISDLLDVLGAWYVDEGRSCDDDVLFVGAGHRHGVAYVWREGRLIIERSAEEATFDHVLDAASAAQRDYHRSTAVGDVIPKIDLNRMGQPDEIAAPAFEEAVRRHYEPSRLAEAIGDYRPRSMLVMPSTPVPLAAMLATEAGIPLACEASMRSAEPDRPIRRLSLWPGTTFHAGFEVEAVTRVAERAGWEIAVHDAVDDADAFLAFYADDDADVLWVSGHGEHSPYRLGESGLVIGNGLVTADQLAGVRRRGGDRRLLVLNVCSGAATQVRGGIARVGLSQELVTPQQQVVAHLWPIGMYAGLAFGAKLALELAAVPPADALARTVSGLRAPDTLRAELRRELGDDLEIHRRLEGQDEQVGSVLSWGAPVLLT